MTFRHSSAPAVFLALLLSSSTLPAEPAQPLEAPRPLLALEKEVPENLADLLEIQRQTEKIVEKVMSATVGVRIGGAQGSGVIVSEDGYVLTAAHVSGQPGRNVTLIFQDGKKVKGKTLGLDRRIDAGLIKITDEGKWPHAEMGTVKGLELGDWTLALGHPGGYKDGRAPVVRLGRIIMIRNNVLQTDCTLVGGDSGGPLFNMQGQVIGIHSRIGATTSWNFHVPISAYTEEWEKLAKSEQLGPQEESENKAVLGISGENHEKGCRITAVAEDLPAGEADLRVGDVITRFDGKEVKGFDQLYNLVGAKKPGDTIEVEFLREDQEMKVEVTLAENPN